MITSLLENSVNPRIGINWNKLLTLSFIHDSQHFQYWDEFADATPSSPPCFTAEAVLNFSLADFH